MAQNMPSAMPKTSAGPSSTTGHQVRQQQDLLPMRMNDGRVLLVPVEQMEIQPVRGPTY